MNKMPLHFSETSISGLSLITPHHFENEYGCFFKYFEKDAFSENGLATEFTEASELISKQGVLRGLHYQDTPSQGRLVRVINGMLFYAVVDLRRDSNTFGKFECFMLSKKLNNAIYIPPNFAHGSLALDDATMYYQSTGQYLPEKCGGIIWNDSGLNIPWPIDMLGVPVMISEKDSKLQTFEGYRRKCYERYKIR